MEAMYKPIPLHLVQIGDYLLTPEGNVWILDSEEALLTLPTASAFYDTLGLAHLFLGFRTFSEANYWFHRN